MSLQKKANWTIVTCISIYKAVMDLKVSKSGLKKLFLNSLRIQPDEVADDPFIDDFRGLLAKEDWWFPLGLLLVPFIVLEMWGNCGWGDCTGVLGLGKQEEVEGIPPAGLLALSLPESLSSSPVFGSPSLWWLIFILLQVGRTLYFKGSGPFYKV